MESMIELTASARSHAARTGLLPSLETVRLSPWVAKGDFVELSHGGRTETFIVRARRVLLRDGGETLVFLLDHPARPALR